MPRRGSRSWRSSPRTPSARSRLPPPPESRRSARPRPVPMRWRRFSRGGLPEGRRRLPCRAISQKTRSISRCARHPGCSVGDRRSAGLFACAPLSGGGEAPRGAQDRARRRRSRRREPRTRESRAQDELRGACSCRRCSPASPRRSSAIATTRWSGRWCSWARAACWPSLPRLRAAHRAGKRNGGRGNDRRGEGPGRDPRLSQPAARRREALARRGVGALAARVGEGRPGARGRDQSADRQGGRRRRGRRAGGTQGAA